MPGTGLAGAAVDAVFGNAASVPIFARDSNFPVVGVVGLVSANGCAKGLTNAGGFTLSCEPERTTGGENSDSGVTRDGGWNRFVDGEPTWLDA